MNAEYRVKTPLGFGTTAALLPIASEIARGRIGIILDGCTTGIRYFDVSEVDGLPTVENIQRLQAMSHENPCLWAVERLRNGAYILDTETTGVGPDVGIIDIALVTARGQVLLNTLVSCDRPMQPGAYRVHHISESELRGKPTIADVWKENVYLFTSREIVIYNASFDVGMLKQSLERYGIPLPPLRSFCLMAAYSAYIGETNGGNSYRNQRLSHACQHFGIPEGTHRALSDAKAARAVLVHLAHSWETPA